MCMWMIESKIMTKGKGGRALSAKFFLEPQFYR